MFKRKLLLAILALTLALSGCVRWPEWNIDPHQLADSNGQFVVVNEVELYFVEEGDATNPTVILVHGFGASTYTWRLTMPALAQAGYHVIALDRPGFGLSSKAETIDYTHAAQADLIAAFMDALSIDTATIVGHSQGGNVVTHFALRYPERLDKLVIVAGAVVRGDDGQGTELNDPVMSLAVSANPLLEQLLEKPLLKTLFVFFLGNYFDKPRVKELMGSAYGDADMLTPEMVEGYYRAFRTPGWERGLIAMTFDNDGNQLSEEAVASITLPTLILWGTADTWVPLSGGEKLHKLLKNSTLITYPGLGHSPMDTIPTTFNADLIAFLEK